MASLGRMVAMADAGRAAFSRATTEETDAGRCVNQLPRAFKHTSHLPMFNVYSVSEDVRFSVAVDT